MNQVVIQLKPGHGASRKACIRSSSRFGITVGTSFALATAKGRFAIDLLDSFAVFLFYRLLSLWVDLQLNK